MSDTTIVIDETHPHHGGCVAWPAIIAGALAILTITLILAPLGSALGFATSMDRGYYDSTSTAKAFTVTAGVWLIVVQWLSAGLGGYLTGRLRRRVIGAHAHEVYFRDTINGFLAWGLSSLAIGLLVFGLGGHAMHHGNMRYDRNAAPITSTATQTTDINGNPVATTAPATTPAATMTDDERKNAAKASFFLFLSLLIGAFIATAASALGGNHRDIHFTQGHIRE